MLTGPRAVPAPFAHRFSNRPVLPTVPEYSRDSQNRALLLWGMRQQVFPPIFFPQGQNITSDGKSWYRSLPEQTPPRMQIAPPLSANGIQSRHPATVDTKEPFQIRLYSYHR